MYAPHAHHACSTAVYMSPELINNRRDHHEYDPGGRPIPFPPDFLLSSCMHKQVMQEKKVPSGDGLYMRTRTHARIRAHACTDACTATPPAAHRASPPPALRDGAAEEADVWACGIWLVALLVGAFPFDNRPGVDDVTAEMQILWVSKIPQVLLDSCDAPWTPRS